MRAPCLLFFYGRYLPEAAGLAIDQFNSFFARLEAQKCCQKQAAAEASYTEAVLR